MIWFATFASKSTVGFPANVLLLLWLAFGPMFAWSDTYMLVGNTFMSAVAYVVLFAVLTAQSRDSAALQAKLDELIRSIDEARNELIGVEDKPIEYIAQLKES
jgi:low affinity Fe/Cu permease